MAPLAGSPHPHRATPQGWLPSPGPLTAKPICKHEWPCPASSSSPVSRDRQTHSSISQMGKLRFRRAGPGPPPPHFKCPGCLAEKEVTPSSQKVRGNHTPGPSNHSLRPLAFDP